MIMEDGVVFIMKSGSVISSADYTRWNNAKWYQRLIGFVFKKYKGRFIDPKPFRCKIKK